MDAAKPHLKLLIGLPLIVGIAGGLAFGAATLYENLHSTAPATLTEEETTVNADPSPENVNTQLSAVDEYALLADLLIEQRQTSVATQPAEHRAAVDITIAVLCKLQNNQTGLGTFPSGPVREEWSTMVFLLEQGGGASTVCTVVSSAATTTATRLLSDDQDGDGLPAAAELWYGSSDTTPDTDADGFSDLDELQKGFSPVGAGSRS